LKVFRVRIFRIRKFLAERCFRRGRSRVEKDIKESNLLHINKDIEVGNDLRNNRDLTEEESLSVLLGTTAIDETPDLQEGERDIFPETCSYRILIALRRIMHFVDIYSKKLAVEHHITGPQLICLYSIVKEGPLTLSELGKRVSLSISTVNGIVDRLEHKGLVVRERKDRDRRKVLITSTDAGEKLTSQAPLPLQDRLAKAVDQLPELEKVSIALSFERVVEMMEIKE